MKDRLKQAYMDVARRFGELSHARRLHVGAIVVRDDRIISIGYNGTPAGWSNECEDKVYMGRDAGGRLDPEEIETSWPFEDEGGRYKLVTKPEVLHAEMNCLMKLAKSNESGNGACMFITHSPCLECAKGIYQAGIAEIYYEKDYRAQYGVEFLKKCKIKIEKLIKDAETDN